MVAPHDKIMHAIAACAKVVKGMGNHKATHGMQDLQALVEATSLLQLPVPRVQERQPSTPQSVNLNKTASQPTVRPPDTRVPPTAKIKRRHHSGRAPYANNNVTSAPVHNTRSRTATAAKLAALPTHNTHSAAHCLKHGQAGARRK